MEAPIQNQPKGHKGLLVVLFLFALIIVAAVFGGLWYLNNKSASTNEIKYDASNTPFMALVTDNQYFAQADAAASARNYGQAKGLYSKALTLAADTFQQGQIEFKIALLEDQLGNPVQAIRLYKNIVANPTYDEYKLVKAYALQSMIELYYANGGDPTITEEIFKDAPYSGLVALGDGMLTYRRLAEYAVTFYPLSIAELRIANWYATYIMATSTPDGSATSTYPAIINDALARANADIDRTKNDPNAAKLIPNALIRKSVLYLNMYKARLVSAQEAEQAARAAVDIFTTIGSPQYDGFARLYYAVFLSGQGEARAADVRSVLVPFYSSTVYTRSYVFSFFASEKDNRLGQKASLIHLAAADPKFKALLLSFGWNEKDF